MVESRELQSASPAELLPHCASTLADRSARARQRKAVLAIFVGRNRDVALAAQQAEQWIVFAQLSREVIIHGLEVELFGHALVTALEGEGSADAGFQLLAGRTQIVAQHRLVETDEHQMRIGLRSAAHRSRQHAAAFVFFHLGAPVAGRGKSRLRGLQRGQNGTCHHELRQCTLHDPLPSYIQRDHTGQKAW
ncbi:hypothetical protein [Mesorhizobium sp. M0029]|uniref:hypothetical protein n=1 Tax=Mesorhizobium sp. M0029 TaxID=2956850 RepID=UPI003337EEF4